MLILKGALLLLLCLLLVGTGRAFALGPDDLRIGRPALTLDLSHPFIDPEPNREPIAQTPSVPGIYRAFLVWRQKYAHLALCTIALCNGSCVDYGDGCLVSAQNPVLPVASAGLVSGSAACAGGCAPSYIKPQYDRSGSFSCHQGACH